MIRGWSFHLLLLLLSLAHCPAKAQTPLLDAIFKNDTLRFDSLVHSTTNLNRIHRSLHTKFGFKRKRRLRNGRIIIDRHARKGVPLVYISRSSLPLTKACLVNNSYFATRLLQAGARPNKKDKAGVLTPLGWAAHNGNLELVKLLLEKGAALNSSNPGWPTSSLIEALEWRHWELASYLIDRGADIHKPDRNGKSALSHAAIQKNLPLARKLIEMGADVNHLDRNGVSVLEDACSYGVLFAEDRTNIGLVQLLLDNGAKVNNHAIHLAAQKGELDMVRLLVRYGAPVDDKLVLDAADGKNVDLVRYLTDSLKLNLLVRDTSGYYGGSALFRALSGYWTNGANRTVNVEFIKWLLEKGALVDQLNEKGENAFSVLVAYGKPDSVTHTAAEMLIQKYPAGQLSRYAVLDYPLKQAARQGLLETSRLFIRNGANVNHYGDDRQTILHQACWHPDNRELITLLVKAGANIDAQDVNGNTPAMGCVIMSRMENLKTLLELGADPNIRDHKGLTLLDLVTSEEIITLLKSKGAKKGIEL